MDGCFVPEGGLCHTSYRNRFYEHVRLAHLFCLSPLSALCRGQLWEAGAHVPGERGVRHSQTDQELVLLVLAPSSGATAGHVDDCVVQTLLLIRFIGKALNLPFSLTTTTSIYAWFSID